MGCIHDTAKCIARDPVHRECHHREMTFAMVDAFKEDFVLPIPHDEGMHGKDSMLAKMPFEWTA